jgi:hypothetical protein
MTLLEYLKRYMHNGYHRIHNVDIDMDTFIEIVRCARQLINHPTLGDVKNNPGFTTLFTINKKYKVHADTRISALKIFYENKINGNKMKTVNGPRGGKVLSNGLNDQYIEGLYIYKI